MARAKRTARADARRRHRAELAAQPPGLETDDPTEPAAAQPATGPAQAAARPGTARTRPGAQRGGLPSGPERPAPAGGIASAFRLAFRPVTLREDLALLPRLVVHRAFWLPILIAAIIAGVIVAFQGREIISGVLAQYFLGPAPMGSVFLAGFLAPRASYLIGALVGLAVGLLTLIAGYAVLPVTNAEAVAQLLLLAPVNGLFFASAAAWYRRFLYLASPARQVQGGGRPGAASSQPSRGKPARGR